MNTDKNSNEKLYYSSCPICSNRVLKDKFRVNDYTIAQCQSCKFMFVKEQVSQEELDNYYSKSSGGINIDGGTIYVKGENLDNLKYYFKNLKSFIQKKVPNGKILDIGCNGGYFLDVMEGYERYGIDRSEVYGKIAKKKYGKNIFIGSFEDYKCPDFLFDCITLQDVLDHMVDPMETLRKCNMLLKPNGILVIKVHDMSSLYAKVTGKRFYAFIPPEHLFYFSRDSIAMALEKASFKIVLSKHIGHLMFLSTVFFRMARRNEKSIFFKLHKATEGTWLGRKKIYKNLHDIITVFAVKKGEVSEK